MSFRVSVSGIPKDQSKGIPRWIERKQHTRPRVHSNVDLISRLRRCTPYMETPLPPDHTLATLNNSSETLSDFYRNISPQFEERVLQLSKRHIQGTE